MVRAKGIKKRWFEIVAPAEFNNVFLGETIAVEPKEIIGRKIIRSLGSVTNDIKKYGINVTFRIADVKEKTASTELVKYELTPAQVRRLAKKAKDKADDSFVCTTRDNIKIRIKPLILARNGVQKGVLSALRRVGRQFFAEQAKELTYSNFMVSLIQGKFYKGMKESMQKIYPLIFTEIRVVEKLH